MTRKLLRRGRTRATRQGWIVLRRFRGAVNRGLDAPEQARARTAQGARNRQKLWNIQATFAALVFRDKGLGFAQTRSKRQLGQPSLPARIDQHRDIQLVLARVKGSQRENPSDVDGFSNLK